MKLDQIKTGAILSYITILLSNAVNLVFTPFMLRCLGQSEYGLYSLIGSFVGYLIILDFGLGNTIIRYVAKYRAENDKKGEQNFLALSLIIYGTMSLIVIVIGLALYYNLGNIFKALTYNELENAKLQFVILIINLAVSLPLNVFSSVMNGYEKFIFPKVINIARVLIRTSILFIVLTMGYKAIAIVILDTVFNLLVLLINMVYTLGKMKVKIRLYSFDRSLLKETFAFSFFIFLNLIVDQIYWRMGHFALGMVAGTAAVAVFAIGMQFPNYYMQFSTAISGLFLPRITQMVVKSVSKDEITNLMIKTGRIQFIILGYVLAGFVILGRQFVELWAGAEYRNAWTLALIVMIALTIPLTQTIGISILQAKNMHAFRSILYLGISIVNIIFTFIFAKIYGAVGAALGTTLSFIVGNVIIMNFYYHYKIGIKIPVFFRGMGKGLFPALIIIMAVGSSVLLFGTQSWIFFAIRAVLFTLIYIMIIWFMGMNNFEKDLLKQPIKSIFNKARLLAQTVTREGNIK